MDKWLWHARLVGTRTLASKIVRSGYLKVNGVRIRKASSLTKQGDTLVFQYNGQIKAIEVLRLADKRVAARDAVKMYLELQI